MKTVLVTGAAGFVGSNLTRQLCNSGYSVKGLVRTEAQADAVRALGAEPIRGDLTDRDSLEEAVKGVDGVFHIAALFRQAGVPKSQYFAVNVEGTRNILDASVKAGVKRFIHCSTVGVHGHIANPPADENTPYNPGDPYQESKCIGEQLVQEYFDSGKIQGVTIRPAMIYGPSDERTLKLFKMLANGKFFYVGPGNALVHFIDVRDLARAFILAMERSELNGQKYIISGESSLALHALVSLTCALMGVREPKIHLPIKPVQLLGSLCEAICTPFNINPPIYRRRVDFFTKDRNFNSRKAAEELKFKPQQNLISELIDIIESYTLDGSIQPKSVSLPLVMTRSMDGKIDYWNKRATKVYGWSKEQAVGNVSHSLLCTLFPDKLEKINSTLAATRKWQGILKHKTRAGENVAVHSSWFMVDRSFTNEPYVFELNRPVISKDISLGLKKRAEALVASMYSTSAYGLAEDLGVRICFCI